MMNKQLYLLQNQDKYLLSKSNEWVDGRDLKELFKTPHRDIALNHLFEVNSHDYQQRIHILDCDIQGHNLPVIADELMPPPLPKKPKPDTSVDGEADTTEAQKEVGNKATAKEPGSLIDHAEQPDNAQESENVRNPQGDLLVQEV